MPTPVEPLKRRTTTTLTQAPRKLPPIGRGDSRRVRLLPCLKTVRRATSLNLGRTQNPQLVAVKAYRPAHRRNSPLQSDSTWNYFSRQKPKATFTQKATSVAEIPIESSVGASHRVARSSSVPSINLGVLGGKSLQSDGILMTNLELLQSKPQSNAKPIQLIIGRGEPPGRPLFLCALDKPRCPRWQKCTWRRHSHD